MEGLTETGAPNPFICVRTRKGGKNGAGVGWGHRMPRPLVPSRPGFHSQVSMRLISCGLCSGADARICALETFCSETLHRLRNQPPRRRSAQPLCRTHSFDAHCRACVRLRVRGLRWQEAQSRMRLIKFAGFLVQVQHQAFVCSSHRGCGGFSSYCVCTLVVIHLQRESPGALYLLIQLFGSLLDYRSDAVKPM